LSVLNIPTAEVFEPLLQPARYKGGHGGRGSAKSHFFGGLLIEEAATEKLDFVCIREVQRTLDQSVKKLLEHKIDDLNVGDYFDVQDRRILTRPGGRVIFEGMQNHTAESIKSLEGYDRAWVEEAQTLSQRSLDLLRPTIRKEDSELWFSWNPRFATDPVDVLLRGDPPDGAIVVRSNYSDNPWFPDVLRMEMEYDRSRDPEKYAHIWLGEYEAHSVARVFKNWAVEEFERPKGTIHRLGADFGFSIDPSVMLRCSIDGNRLYIDYEAYMIGCEIVNLPDLFMSIPEAEKWPSAADSARPETISHLRKHGFPKIQAAIKGPKSLEEGVAFLQSFDIIVHPRCRHLIDELTMYRYKTDPLTNNVLPILEDKNNHCIDALRYACEGARRAGKHLPTRKPIKPRPATAGGWMR
jgi:phage terminase large subunit